MPKPGDRVVHVSRDPEAPSVAVVTLDNPARRNAFSLLVREQLYETLEHLMYRDEDCRAIVLTGAGGAFCSGGDISEMKERRVIEQRDRSRLTTQIFELLADGPRPVVAAVEGAAMGAGLALAAVADEIVAARNARFCAAFVHVGLLPDTGLYWSLPQRTGGGRARELCMTGRTFGADEALRIGFANEVTEPGATLAAACARARRYLAMPPLALAHVRSVLARGISTLDQAIESEAHFQPLLRGSSDHAEAVAAFLQKRSPTFVDN